MLKPAYFTLTLLILALLTLGCSGGGANPIAPSDDGASITHESERNSQRFLLGVYEVNIDTVTSQLTIEPARNALTHYNITDYINPPQCDDCLDIEVLEFKPAIHYVKLKVAIRNPTPLTVYDVRGIVMSNIEGMRLLNADSYTDLWDDGGGITINPFRAFATDWPHREILPDTGHARIYEIEYSTLFDLLNILLIFDASWPGNCEEPYSIENFMQLGELYDCTASSVEIQVDVLDWQDDVNEVVLIAPEMTGVPYFPLISDGYNQWSAFIYNMKDLEVGEYDLFLRARSLNSGGLALYQNITITIIKPPPIIINSIEPESGYRGSYLADVSIMATNLPGLSLKAKLKKDGAPDIECNYVHKSGGVIKCEFGIPQDAPLGLYDVEVSYTYDGSWTGEELFEVLETPFPDLADVTPPWLNFSPMDVFKEGDYAYIAGGVCGLHIFDISNPAIPVWVSWVDTPGTAKRVTVSDGYAYVADYKEGLQIIDVDPPESPYIVANVDTIDNAYDVAVSNGYAYVAADDSDLQIIDIDPPESASIVNTVGAEYAGRYVAVSGNYAYLGSFHYFSPGGYWGRLHIIDIETPESAFLVNSLVGVDEPRGLEASDGYVFMGEYDLVWDWDHWVTVSNFYVYDVDPPEEMHKVKTVGTPHIVTDVAISDGYAYVTNDNKYLNIIDISVPENAYLVNPFETPGEPVGVSVSDGYAYVVDRGGLHVIDVDPAGSPYIESSVGTPGDALDVAASGGYVYVADKPSGLHIIDVATPELANVFKTVYTPSAALSVDVSGGYAYIADDYYGYDSSLIIIDVDPPASAQIINSVEMKIEDVAVSGGYAYVAGSGLNIVDVDPPNEAFIVNSLAPDADYIAVSGDYAYAINNGLEIIDINPPEDAFIVNTIPLTGYNYRLAISGGYAYVANRSHGLYIIDIDPPESAYLVNSVATPGDASGVAISGNYAYVARSLSYYTGAAGLEIIDITSPEEAHVLCTIDLPANAVTVAVSNGYAYVVCEHGGLRIIKLW